MKKELIEDDAEAKAIADKYEVTASMMAASDKQLPESRAANTGVVIVLKRAAPVDNMKGPFEFVFISYFAGFIEGENGWSVVRWSEVTWEELPQFAWELKRVEEELLPKAVGSDSATRRLEEYRKSKEKQ